MEIGDAELAAQLTGERLPGDGADRLDREAGEIALRRRLPGARPAGARARGELRPLRVDSYARSARRARDLRGQLDVALERQLADRGRQLVERSARYVDGRLHRQIPRHRREPAG